MLHRHVYSYHDLPTRIYRNVYVYKNISAESYIYIYVSILHIQKISVAIIRL